ncbi:MAG: RDD family protein [Verrucomicrobiota bacterium]
MDIWIIRNGEKVGPIHDYEARRRILSGELACDTHGWHEGLDTWRPLSEMAIFKDDCDGLQFIDVNTEHTPGDEESEILDAVKASPPPLPSSLALGRRFWARSFDIQVYIAVWWLSMWVTGRNIDAVFSNLWIMVAQLVPWFILESILIHHFGTTPGKWLLGLHVANTNGTPLNLAAATLRSFRVLFGGIGFGWGLLAVFCQTLSYFTAKRLGSALWDKAGGHRVLAQPLVAWRVTIMACVFFAALQLQMAVIGPSIYKYAAEKFPFMKEELEKTQPWQLPPR